MKSLCVSIPQPRINGLFIFSRVLYLFEMLLGWEVDVKWTIKNQDMKVRAEFELRHIFTS